MTIDVFTASGTFTPPTGVTSVDVLVVGGGGSGGKGNLSTTMGGGGGAGGVKVFSGVAVTPGVGVTVTVGAGGAGQPTNLTDGNFGSGSAFGANTVSGGGGGGAGSSTTSTANAVAPSGGASGGGGGCSSSSTGSPFAGGNSISGEGHNGGSGIGQLSPSDGRNAGGGGGAGAAGTNGTSGNTTPFTQWMGHGGAGADHSAAFGTSFGVSGLVGGGGGGGTSQQGAAPQPSGGTGGGGAGAQPSVAPGSGTANTGGGGGGSGSGFTSGAGGSGVVVVKYTPPSAPGVPTSVTATPHPTSIDLAWSAPSTGGTVTSYEVRLNGGSWSTATSPHAFTGLTPSTSYTVDVRAVGPGGNSSPVSTVISTLADLPGIPTSVSATPDTTSIDLAWSPPSTGGAVTSYEVRLNGGSWSTATSPHTFTGLTLGTSYTVEVRAVGPGGNSSPVLLTVWTLPAPGYYRVELALGSHSWSVEQGDPAAYGPTLPMSLGWDISDSVEFFPAQADLTTLSFGVRVPDAADLADVVKGDTVTMSMYVSIDPDAAPWQTFAGIVTQLEGETLPSLDPDADENARDFRMTVFAADDNARLGNLFCGFVGGNWPIESISDRIDRICTEAGIARVNGIAGGAHGLGMQGWLPARPQGAPLSVLEAIKQTLRDAADDYDSEPPDEFYGRYVFEYNHAATDDLDAETLYIHVFRRRLFGTDTLDGGLVHSNNARWTKQPGPSQASWVVVDGAIFGTPGNTVPVVRNTGLLDYFGPGGLDPNYSAAERDNLGESLLPDGSTALDGWAARTLRYAAYVDPGPVTGWASYAPPTRPQSVVITPILGELEVNGEDYLAGTLTGARLVLAPGGRFYVDLRLRSELLPGTDLP